MKNKILILLSLVLGVFTAQSRADSSNDFFVKPIGPHIIEAIPVTPFSEPSTPHSRHDNSGAIIAGTVIVGVITYAMIHQFTHHMAPKVTVVPYAVTNGGGMVWNKRF